jgi:spore coat polysaccharide biosynthesis predicted glycosyltransferase SpsG
MSCFIYTYGSHQRGMGHIYQSGALAEALAEELAMRPVFLVPDFPEGVAKLLEWGHEVVAVPRHLTGPHRIAYLEDRVPGAVEVVVVDVLESDRELMEHFRSRAQCLVSLDDIGEGRVHADLLVNVIHHPPRPAGATYTEISDLGYVILRQAFHAVHELPKPVPARARRILVSQGGSDTFGGVVELLSALVAVPAEVQVLLVVGPACRHEAQLRDALGRAPRSFVVLRDVADMAGLMHSCDLAVTGAGKTVFELAAAGVPFIVVTEEPRELETAGIVAERILCENLGLRAQTGAERIAATVTGLIDDQERRASMSRSGQAAVDGRGAWRTAAAIARTWRSRQGGGHATAV